MKTLDNRVTCTLLNLLWFISSRNSACMTLFFLTVVEDYFILTVVEDYLEEDGTVSTMKCFNFFKNSP